MGRYRVGFDALRALRNRTGLGNYSRGVLGALRAHDPQLDIDLYSPEPPLFEYHELAQELTATLHQASGRTRVGRRLWRTFRLGRQAARDRVDLYHGLTHEIPRDLPRTGVPSVVTVHDLIHEHHPHLFSVFDRWSYRWRYRWSARHATAVVAVSERTQRDLVERYGVNPARVTVIPPVRNAAFTEEISAENRREVRARYGLPESYLLSVGTLETRKNQRVLIAALAQLPDDLPLVLIGSDGGTESRLRKLARQLRLEARVLFRSGIATPDLPALVQSAAIFLYPSIIEGFGMPVVEAQSAGAPVIAAAGGHLVEAGGPGTRYVAPNDPAAWAAAIGEVLGDRQATRLMRTRGWEHAGRFDGEKLAAQLVAVYDAVVGSTGHGARGAGRDTGPGNTREG